MTKAGQEIVHENELYILKGAETTNKNPVVSDIKEVLVAIAFEKLIYRELSPYRFGIFSAFCTYADFITSDSVLSELPYRWEKHCQENESDAELIALYLATQDRLLPKRVWSPDLVTDDSEAIDSLSKAIGKMNSVEIALLCLMFGMHEARVFEALAFVISLLDYDVYADLHANSFQSDFGFEGNIHLEASYLGLFRDIMKESKGSKVDSNFTKS